MSFNEAAKRPKAGRGQIELAVAAATVSVVGRRIA